MTAKILDGKQLSQIIIADLKAKVESDKNLGLRPPHLEVLLVGEDKPSEIYVKNKAKACQLAGFSAKTQKLPSSVTEAALIELIQELNNDYTVDGILVQLPLPDHIPTQTIIETISVDKDVDGFHPYNVGRLSVRKPHLRPCTPYGVMLLLEHYDINPRGMDVTIVGVSNIVGRPLVLEMLLAGATVTACHRHTQDLQKHVQNADMVVSATGVMDLLKPNWFKPNAVVIDIGIHRLESGKIRGDIDFGSVKEKVNCLTPVPGGVGPMTVASLLSNTYQACTINRNRG